MTKQFKWLALVGVVALVGACGGSQDDVVIRTDTQNAGTSDKASGAADASADSAATAASGQASNKAK